MCIWIQYGRKMPSYIRVNSVHWYWMPSAAVPSCHLMLSPGSSGRLYCQVTGQASGCHISLGMAVVCCEKVTCYRWSYCHSWHGRWLAEWRQGVMVGPGTHPTDKVLIKFEIRPKFAVLWFKKYSTDHNKILHMSRHLHCREVQNFVVTGRIHFK